MYSGALIGGPAGTKLALIAVVLIDQPEEIVTQAKVNRQVASNLNVVIDITTVVVFSVIGQGNVGDEYAL